MSEGDKIEAASDDWLAVVLGADTAASVQQLTLFIPDKDRDENDLGNQQEWVRRAAELLVRIGGGVTVLPPCRGGWLNPETDKIVWEQPILVYTFVKPDKFEALLPDLRSFLHRLGRETNQGEVACDFDGTFYRISHFDPADVGEER